eukprot:TRINITY_DN41047_c0_g1_i1.p1 TRINITY_DN41047_c0_g1~~TRINITY_DN41047_c0_g1_i1.p1  ORF type:complete len:508 (-),score=60.93 TRINITY_DN41047_c0_g1_i1:33-1556(-)
MGCCTNNDMSTTASLSPWQKRAYMAFAIVSIALTGGGIYGWASMRAVLLRDGSLRDNCEDGVKDCVEQELALGLLYTFGSWSNQGSRLFSGIALDFIGPRRTAILSTIVCSAGILVFSLTTSLPGMSVGILFFGGGAAGVQLALQSVTSLFPKRKSTAMASLSGAFQAASVIFMICNELHKSGISRQNMLLCYAAVVFVICMCSFVWPDRPFGTAPRKTLDVEQAAAVPVTTSSVRRTALKDQTFSGQLRSLEYKVLLAWFMTGSFVTQFTVGAVGAQFEQKGDDGSVTSFFTLLIALSFIFTPFVGMLADRFGFVRIMSVVHILTILMQASLMLPWLGVQYATCVLYSVSRVSLWAIFFSFAGANFGFAHYGKLVGGTLFTVSVVVLLQYPLMALSLGPFQASFIPVNIFFICVLCMAFPCLAALHVHWKAQADLDAKAKEADVSVAAEVMKPSSIVSSTAAPLGSDPAVLGLHDESCNEIAVAIDRGDGGQLQKAEVASCGSCSL